MHRIQKIDMKLAVYCLKWHIDGGSVRDLVVDPLKDHFDIHLIPWDGISLSRSSLLADADISLWFQFPPPKNALAAPGRHVWQPMWDDCRRDSQSKWNRLPKSLQVVAFSHAAAVKARLAGLPTLELQYFKKPESFVPADWSKGRVALYWNRKGIIGPDFVARFCETLNIDILLFRPTVDSASFNAAEYTLPSLLGSTKVEVLPPTMEREEFWKQTARANILIAPRLYEGAGMFFLEALARGCGVFAHDAPTMSEYITHGVDGYLLKSTWNLERLSYSLRVRIAKLAGIAMPAFHFPIRAEAQNWAKIARTDLEELGTRALESHKRGYDRWQSNIPSYVEFMRQGVLQK